MEEAKYNELYGVRSRLEKTFPEFFSKDYLDSLRVAEYIIAMKTSPEKIPPEDMAWVYWLLQVAMKLFETYVEFQDRGWCHTDEEDAALSNIDTCYIFVINKLDGLYKKYPALDKNPFNLTHAYTTLSGNTYLEEKQWLYGNEERLVLTAKIDYMHEIAELKRFCVLNGTLEPTPDNEIDEKLKALVEKTLAGIEKIWEQHREISSYTLELTETGNVVINGVWIIKEKLQKGTRPWNLLTQAIKNDGQKFIPEKVQGSRKMTQVLEQINIKGPLREMFFPLFKESGEILFRSSVSGTEARKEGIDTKNIDEELKRRGGETNASYNPLLGVRRLNLRGIPVEDQFEIGDSVIKSFDVNLETGEGIKELADSIKESFERNKKKKETTIPTLPKDMLS